MSFVDRFTNDPWFAFSNIAVVGTLGYLFLDRVLSKDKGEPAIQPSSISTSAVDNTTSKKSKKRKPIHKIVFSGGPCAGKTTACEEVKKVFEPRGYKVMIVP